MQDDPVDVAADAGPHTADERRYHSIRETSERVGVKPHVLRYWETQFGMLRPRKNRAGNRMYRAEDIRTLLRIKELLYERRFTIAGARRHLLEARRAAPAAAAPSVAAERRLLLGEVRAELRALLERLREGDDA
jgi:DNA-binding transcriptional MerR regulator